MTLRGEVQRGRHAVEIVGEQVGVRRDRGPDMVSGMVDIGQSLNELVQRRLAEAKERAYYELGLTRATEDILTGLFRDESVARATEAFESRPELPADERMTHALVAALGARIVSDPDGRLTVVPLDDDTPHSSGRGNG